MAPRRSALGNFSVFACVLCELECGPFIHVAFCSLNLTGMGWHFSPSLMHNYILFCISSCMRAYATEAALQGDRWRMGA